MRRVTPAARGADQPAQPREGQEQIDSRTSLAALQASLATLRTENERLTGLAGAGGDKDARIAALSKELAENKTLSNEALAKVDLLNQQLLALRRQMAAMQRGAQRGRSQGQGEPGAHLRPGRPPQRRAGPPGAGVAALPVRLLRPPARAAARPQGHPRGRRPLRVPVRGAVPVRTGDHDGRGSGGHRPAGGGHRRAGALASRPRSTGRCRSTATPTPGRSPARSFPPTGSCRARARPRLSNI